MTQSAYGPSNLSAQKALYESLHTMVLPYVLQAAAHYNYATLIGDSNKTTEDLARETETKESWVFRILRFLAAQGIFVEVAPRTFSNTDVSTYLRDDVSGSLRNMARMMGSERYRGCWASIEKCMCTGEAAIEINYGTTFYAYLAEHPEEEAIFNAAMTGYSAMMNEAIATHYDFSSIHKLIDVGGGYGSLLTTILSHYPALKGVLFDRPSVIEKVIASCTNGISYELVAGNFFEGVPGDADAYVLKKIIHNWSDEESRTILRNCRQVMQPGAVVLVCEQMVPPENNQGVAVKGLDLLMGLELQGCERTVEEFRALFESAGLRLARVIETPARCAIIEAVVAQEEG
jgi:hypothetical protein